MKHSDSYFQVFNTVIKTYYSISVKTDALEKSCLFIIWEKYDFPEKHTGSKTQISLLAPVSYKHQATPQSVIKAGVSH